MRQLGKIMASAGVFTMVACSGVTIPALAKTTSSILTTVPHVLVKAVTSDKVYTSTGKLVTLPTNQPDFFAAWWCPHCHEALKQLKVDHKLGTFDLISIYVNGDTTKPVKTWKQALALTERSLRQLGVKVPISHIYLALPNSPINRQISGVPTLWKFAKGKQAKELVGTPSTASVWKMVL